MLQLAAISEKWRKIISTGRKSSFPPARISCFFQNCFLLIPIMVSTSSKIVLTKKILFPLGAKSVSTSWMEDIEKYVTTIWKSCFYFKKFLKKKWCPMVPLYKLTFTSFQSQSPLAKTISETKNSCSSRQKILVSSDRYEELAEKYALVKGKDKLLPLATAHQCLKK